MQVPLPSYDAIVVGAGPGGSATAAFMARSGLRVLLIDKDTFPRDKICGDAVGGKSFGVMERIGLLPHMQAVEQVGSWGVTFSGPYGDSVSIPFTTDTKRAIPPCFICARKVFDDLVLQRADAHGAEIWLEATVKGLLREGEGGGPVTGVRVQRNGHVEEVRAPLVVGADGAYSVVARELGITQLNEKHYCASVRAYYEGVTGFHDGDYMELHYIPEVMPGYFWIFPMANGCANVGLGMLSSAIKKRNIKLKPLLDSCIQHPRLRDRFAEAERMGTVKGWGLPLGSKPRTMAGDGWLLIGDAASLVDPFTGEGIGNALVSGEQAARWAVLAHTENNFSEAFLKGYEKEVLDLIKDELRVSHLMQKLGNWKWLLNTVIRKASRSEELADTISCMFDDVGERRRLFNPLFYLRVLAA